MTTVKIVGISGRTIAEIAAIGVRDAIQRLVADRADLYGADLRGANLGDRLPYFQICPQEGSFIAYKATHEAILTLEICADAQRTSSLIGRKCRASAVRVVAASRETPDGVYHSKHDREFTYRVGDVASVDDFDADPRVECTRGIHFFMTRQEAEDY